MALAEAREVSHAALDVDDGLGVARSEGGAAAIGQHAKIEREREDKEVYVFSTRAVAVPRDWYCCTGPLIRLLVQGVTSTVAKLQTNGQTLLN